MPTPNANDPLPPPDHTHALESEEIEVGLTVTFVIDNVRYMNGSPESSG